MISCLIIIILILIFITLLFLSSFPFLFNKKDPPYYVRLKSGYFRILRFSCTVCFFLFKLYSFFIPNFILDFSRICALSCKTSDDTLSILRYDANSELNRNSNSQPNHNKPKPNSQPNLNPLGIEKNLIRPRRRHCREVFRKFLTNLVEIGYKPSVTQLVSPSVY